MNSVESALTKRLEEARAEHTHLRNQLRSVDASFKTAMGSISRIKRPNMTEKEAIEAIKKKEHTHATTSQTNAEERQFMRDMEKLNQMRKDAAEHARLQAILDVIKAERTALLTRIKEFEGMLDDLHAGDRKLKAAAQLSCPPSELVQSKFSIGAEELGRVIMKAGYAMKRLEDAHHVLIDVERSSSSVRICGTQQAVGEAHAAIVAIGNTLTEECRVQDELFSCLKPGKVAELQEAHGVTLGCLRGVGICRITGSKEGVEGVKEELRRIPVMKQEIAISKACMPFIIGKAGATVRSVRETYEVEIETPKVVPGAAAAAAGDDQPVTVIVVGLKENVQRAVEFLSNLVDENTEVTDTIESEKHILLGCVSGGNVLPSLQRELNVRLRIQGENRNVLAITGLKSPVLNAKVHFLKMLEKHVQETVVVIVPDYVTPIILGKKGSKIKEMRETFPDVTLDIIDSTIIHIAGSSDAVRQEVKAAIMKIVEANTRAVVDMPDKTLSLLKSPKGAALRTQITSDLHLVMDIVDGLDRMAAMNISASSAAAAAAAASASATATASKGDGSIGSVKLRGPSANVNEGVKLLEEFRDEHSVVDLTEHSDDDCTVVQNYMSKSLEAKYGVEVYVNRKNKSIQVRGKSADVAQASAHIAKVLGGKDASMGSLKVHVSAFAFPSLIGKGGSTIQKFESEYDVKVDMIRASNEIRIRADQPEKVVEAKKGILTFLHAVRKAETVRVPEKFKAVSAPASSAAASDDKDEDRDATTDAAADDADADADAEGDEEANTTTKATPAPAAKRTPPAEENIKFDPIVLESVTVCAKSFGVLIERFRGNYALRGRLDQLEEAQKYLDEVFNNYAERELRIATDEQVLALQSKSIISTVERECFDDELQGSGSSAAVGLTVDPMTRVLVIRGPTECVRKAFVSVFEHLATHFPSNYLVFPFETKSLNMIPCPELYQLNESVSDDAQLLMDRINGCVRVAGSEEACRSCVQFFIAKKREIAERRAVITVDNANAVGALVNGKKIGKFLTINDETGCTAHFNRETNTVAVEGANKDNVQKAVGILNARLEVLAKEYWQCTIKDIHVGPFLGKGGANIKQLRTDTGAQVDLHGESRVVMVSGTEQAVQAAREKVETILHDLDANNCVDEVKIPTDAALPLIVGAKGAVIRELSERTGAKIDINRIKRVASLRGTKDACDQAVAAINEIMEKAGFIASAEERAAQEAEAAKAAAKAKEAAEAAAKSASATANGAAYTSVPVVPGATRGMIERMTQIVDESKLSKSALRRKRRKERGDAAPEGEEASVEREENNVAPAVIAPPAPAAASAKSAGKNSGGQGKVAAAEPAVSPANVVDVSAFTTHVQPAEEVRAAAAASASASATAAPLAVSTDPFFSKLLRDPASATQSSFSAPPTNASAASASASASALSPVAAPAPAPAAVATSGFSSMMRAADAAPVAGMSAGTGNNPIAALLQQQQQQQGPSYYGGIGSILGSGGAAQAATAAPAPAQASPFQSMLSAAPTSSMDFYAKYVASASAGNGSSTAANGDTGAASKTSATSGNRLSSKSGFTVRL